MFPAPLHAIKVARMQGDFVVCCVEWCCFADMRMWCDGGNLVVVSKVTELGGGGGERRGRLKEWWSWKRGKTVRRSHSQEGLEEE